MTHKILLKEELIINLYKKGNSVIKIAKLFNCSITPIKRILKANKIKIKPSSSYLKGKPSKKRINLPENEVIDMYLNQNIPADKIAEHFNCCFSVVYRILRHNKIPIKRLYSFKGKLSLPIKKGNLTIEEARKKLFKDMDVRRRLGYNLGRKRTEKAKLETGKSMKKWWEKNRGSNKTIEMSRKISEKRKGMVFTKEHKRNLSESHNGKKFSEERIKKMRGIPKTREFKRKISETLRRDYKEGKWTPTWKGKHLSEETKRKMRISAFNYIKNMCGNAFPKIGHNEKKILDELEQKLNHKILRQFEVEGYFIDGYIPELNIAIEVDEIPKVQERDIKRQKLIETKLNCKFIRINDFD